MKTQKTDGELKERVFSAIAGAAKPLDFIDLMVLFCPRDGPKVKFRRLVWAHASLLEEGRIYARIQTVTEQVKCRDGTFPCRRQITVYEALRSEVAP